MSCFLVVSDDEFRAFVNADAITMFRVKKGKDGKIPSEGGEAEIEFVGGSKTRLVGETAQHFITAMNKHLGRGTVS